MEGVQPIRLCSGQNCDVTVIVPKGMVWFVRLYNFYQYDDILILYSLYNYQFQSTVARREYWTLAGSEISYVEFSNNI